MAVFRWTVGGIAVAVLVACGGGGGGGSSTGSGGIVTGSSLALTSANYVAASQEVFATSDIVQVSSALVTGVETVSATAASKFAQAQLEKVPAWFRNAPVVVAGAVFSNASACSGGGFITYTLNDQGQLNVFDAGDTVTLTATNCNESGNVVNGQLTMAANSVTGTFGQPPYSATVTMSFSNLAVVVSNGSLAMNGITTMSLNVPSITTEFVTGMQTNPSLQLNGSFGGAAYTSTLTNYSSQQTRARPPNNGILVNSTTGGGTVVSSSLGSQAVLFSILQPFSYVVGDTFSSEMPFSGQMLLSGANGSKVRITVQSSFQVLIELDADGNGTYETSTTKAWSSLL